MLVPWQTRTVYVYFEGQEYPETAQVPEEWSGAQAWADFIRQGVEGVIRIEAQWV